ncbi:amino acid/amide ABC transporter substrate-binding protein, HAAT family [Bradyrhizobium lablabi]|uniref:Amino acid/amide ABC transporter substrate-binding protein, HAAT family n=2 Tax=Bradyrhizobium TaxID=374 RepID=A0ABY0Q8Q5_9BRAD|nr:MULTISPECIES: ABC transporter substrate-binding protein [Bradyrhizobium]SDJ70254.1 amino acid/amide ABC transporter substrate-binding protein, HAAT family [Bradyrhizobium ottawaense]SEC23480.1 amino acid/amide ABC transporter substrate-binding protein, HAAT family [Bradyrhizobium lablabi]
MKAKTLGLAIAALLIVSEAANAQISDDAVKIGVLTDHSGGFAYLVGKHSVEAAQMAVDDFGGKVLGKPITIVTADHQNKADIAATLSRKWFDTEGVDAVTDVAGSAVALATQEIARSRNKILLISGAATTELTGKACSGTTSQWSYDTYAFAKGTASQVTKQGGNSWFFLTSDYAFGHSLLADASRFVEENGGKVVGSVRFPFGSPDFSSFLLQAQASKAKVIGLAMSGADLLNAIKQAREFGIVQSGQNLASLVIYINDIEGVGLDIAQGLTLTTSFYWDTNDETRAWSKRFMERSGGFIPNLITAGTYASVLHYLKAVQAAGTDDGKVVAAKMREMPVNDFYNKNVEIRADGRVMHKTYLMKVKSPSESQYRGDYYRVVAEMSGEQSFKPLADSQCPLIATK